MVPAKDYKTELEAALGEARPIELINPNVVRISFEGCSGDFITNYIQYAKTQTDAPEIYHELVGLTLLATILNGSVRRGRIKPNIYGVLVGKSTIMRKSESINVAIRILYKFNRSLVIPNDFTPEGLTKKLSENSKGLIHWSEFGQFLSSSGKSYMAGIKEMITDIFDCPDERRRMLRTGEIIIKSPYVNIITGTTEKWLKVDRNDLMGGFLGRFIFIHAKLDEKDIRYSLPPDENVEGENRILNTLAELAMLNLEMVFTKEAEDIYSEFEKKLEDEVATLADEKGESSFLGRLAIYGIKLSILYQVSQNPRKEIEVAAINRAINFVERAKKNILYLLENQLGDSEFENNKKRVLAMIRKHSPIERSRLMQNVNNISKDYLDKILDTLIDSGLVEVINEPAQGSKVKRYYKIVNL